MKKIILLKKIALACLFVMAVALSCPVTHAQQPLVVPNSNEETTPPRRLGTEQVINISVTPTDVIADTHAITIKKGDVLTIIGKVNYPIPNDDHLVFERIGVSLHYYHFFKVLTKESAMTQRSNTFTFLFKANSTGEEKITFNMLWSQNGQRNIYDDLCPIIVTVK